MGANESKYNLKDIQKVQLDILLEFDKICKKNKLKYQLFAGTLLGAIRHEGFIPWDDDVDVCMLREDYEQFISLSKEEFGECYFLQTFETDPNYVMQFAKLRKKNTIFLEKNTSECNIHHGVYIDVFPLDEVRVNSFLGIIQQKALYTIGRLNLTRMKMVCKNGNNQLGKSLRLTLHYILKLLPNMITNNLQKKICCMFNNRLNNGYLSHLTNGASKTRIDKYLMRKKDFEDIIEIKFEGHYFPGPKEYDLVLTRLFGDYRTLPPVSEREPHHGIIEIKLNN